jgi:proline iminopeptidase
MEGTYLMRITVNDTALYFDVEGTGLVPDGQTLRERPVIVALHGGPGFDHAYFKPALSVLTDMAQVIYVDLRGQGRSDRVPVATCTLEQMADDVAAFCRALGLASPVILGHSAGGFVALHLAVRHPDLVGRLILVDTAAATADMGDAMGRLEQRRGPEARAAGQRVFGGDFSPESMADFGRLVLPAYVHDPATAGAMFEALGRSSFSAEVASYYFREHAPCYDLREQLGDIGVPTLVVVGESDWLCPPSAAQVIAAGVPQADLVVIPEAGHFSFGEQPACFADAVHRFLITG